MIKRCNFCNKELLEYYKHFEGKACSRICANKIIDLKGGESIGYRLNTSTKKKDTRLRLRG